jgi:tetratricopeptide (TPR) repeat protein
LVLGDYLRDSGDLEAAESYYARASLLENHPVAPLLRIAELSARMGDANAARDYLAQAEAAARSPLEKGQVRAAAGLLEQRLGRILAAIDQLRRQEEYLSEALPPFQMVVVTYAPMIDAYACLGELELAREKLESARELIQPPLDKFLAFSEAALLIEEGDLERARAAMALGAELIEQFKLEDLKARVDGLKGEILRQEGEYAASANAFRASIERIERSAAVGNELFVLLPTIFSHLAESLILSGDLDGAEHALNEGFRMDPSHPMLWVAKARWQHAAGLTELARASLNYALAIWKDADPAYREYRRARELLGEFGNST